MTDPRTAWADLLALPADATAEDATSAFLRSMPDDFLPAGEAVAAVSALAGAAVPAGRDFTADELLAAEVEAFAARYWSLDPVARLAAWSELSRRGAPAGRLRELEPALDLAPPAMRDPAAEELAELFRALFVLPPRERAIRRNGWLVEHAADADKWRTALAAVVRTAPAVSALDPQLEAALGPDFPLVAFFTGATAAPRARASVADDMADFKTRMREYERTGGASPPGLTERAERAQSRFWWGLGAAVVVVIVIAVVSSGGNSSRSSTNTPVLRMSFTAAEVAEFERYERDKNAGRSTTQPSRYAAWVLSGRPASVSSGTTQLTFTFERATIQSCQWYDQTKSGTKPVLYDLWVRAGKPAAPGTYPIR